MKSQTLEYRAGYRIDLIDTGDGRPFREMYRATGPLDRSGHHSTLTSYGPCPSCGGPAYCSDCPSCWLGHGHTCDYHAAVLAAPAGQLP